MYSVDAVVRHASSLQQLVPAPCVRMNSKTASTASLKDGDHALVQEGESELAMPVCLDERVPDNTVRLNVGDSIALGRGFVPVKLVKRA